MLGTNRGSDVLQLRSLQEYLRTLFSAASGRLGLRAVAPYRSGGSTSGNLGLEPESWASGVQLEMDMTGLPRHFPNGGRPIRPTQAGRPGDVHQPPMRVPESIPPRRTSFPPPPSPPEIVRSGKTPRMKASPTGHMQRVAVDNPKVPLEGVANTQVSRFSEDPVPDPSKLDGLMFIGAPSEPQVIEPQPQAIIDSPVRPISGSMDNASRIIDFLAQQLPPLHPTPSSKSNHVALEPRQLPSREMPPPPRPGLTRDQSFPPVCPSLPDDLTQLVDDEIFPGKRGPRGKNDAAGGRGHSGGNPAIMGRGNAHRDHEQDEYGILDIFSVAPVDPNGRHTGNTGSSNSGSNSRSKNGNGAASGANRVKHAAVASQEAQGSPSSQDVRTQPERDFKRLEAMIPGLTQNRWASTRRSPVGTPANNMIDGEEKAKSSLSPPPPPSSSSQLPSRVGAGGVREGLMTTGDTRKRPLSMGNNVSNSAFLNKKRRKHHENDPSRGRQRGGRGGSVRNGIMQGDKEPAAVGQPEADFGLARVGNGKLARAEMMDVGLGVGGYRRQAAGIEPEPLFSEDLLLSLSSDQEHSLDSLHPRIADSSVPEDFFFAST